MHTILISKFSVPTINADEYAYWAIAASSKGYDWSSFLSRHTAYYSYGYSIFLIPLYILFANYASMYKAALAINAMFAVGLFLISYYLLKRRHPDFTKRKIQLLAFCCSFYAPILVQSYISWPETLIYLLSILSVLLAYKTIEKNKLLATVIFACVSSFLYITHNRNLGILVACVVLVIIALWIKRLSLKQIVVFIGTVVAFIALNSVIKGQLIEHLWKNGRLVGLTQLDDQIRKVISLLTLKGALDFLGTLCGQLFYIGSASFFLVFHGVYGILNNAYKHFKLSGYPPDGEKRSFYFRLCSLFNNTQVLIELFVFFAFLFTLLISVLFMSDGTGGINAVYGRYNDPLVFIMSLYGVSYLIQKQRQNKLTLQIIFSSLYILFGVVTHFYVQLKKVGAYNPPNAIPLQIFFDYNNLYVFPCIIVVLLVSWLLLVVSEKKTNKYFSTTIIICVLAYNVILAGSVIKNELFRHQEQAEHIMPMIIEQINYWPQDTPVYVLTRTNIIANLQFMIYDRPIKSITDYNQIEEPGLIITNLASYKDLILQEEYNYISQISGVDFWIHKSYESQNQQVPNGKYFIPLNYFTQDSKPPQFIQSNGAPQYLTSGPYINLPKGSYNVCVSYMLVAPSDDNNTGNVEICYEKGSVLTEPVWLPLDVVGIKNEINIHIKTFRDINRFEIRTFCCEGAIIIVYGLYITRITDDTGIMVPISDIAHVHGEIVNDILDISPQYEGFLLYGPYITLPPGEYLLKMNFELVNQPFISKDIGFIDIVSNGEVFAIANISADMFNNGSCQLQLPFHLYTQTQDLEFRYYKHAGISVRVGHVSYKKVESEFDKWFSHCIINS